jgi:hypothetical protein
MKYERYVDGVLVETFTPPEGVTLMDCFHPLLAAQFIEVVDPVTAPEEPTEAPTEALAA